MVCALLLGGALALPTPAEARRDGGGLRRSVVDKRASRPPPPPGKSQSSEEGQAEDADALGDGEDPGADPAEAEGAADGGSQEDLPTAPEVVAPPAAAPVAGADGGMELPPATALGDQSSSSALARAQQSIRVDRTTYSALLGVWGARRQNGAGGDGLSVLVSNFRAMGGGAPGGGQAKDLSLALLAESLEARAAGQDERALGLAEVAAILGPSITATHLAAARGRLKKELGSPGLYLDSFSAALRAEVSDLENLVRWAFAVSIGLALALAGLLLGLAVLRAGRGFKRYIHDAGHWMPPPFRGFTSTVLALGLASLPLVLGVGLLPTALWWITLTWGYLDSRARLAMALGAVGTLAIPWLMEVSAMALAFPGSDAHKLAVAHTDLGRVDDIRRQVWPPDSPVSLGVRGLMFKRLGQTHDAQRVLRNAVTMDAKSPWLHDNLGCVFGAMGDLERALREFERATEVDPTDVVALHNAATIHSMLQRGGAARDAWDEAARLDSHLAAGLKRRADAPPPRSHNVALLDAPPPQHLLLSMVFKSSPQADDMAEELWRQYSPRLNVLGYNALVLAMLVLWGLLTILSRRTQPTVTCPRCGSLVCADCMGRETDGTHCPVCVSMMSRTLWVEPAVRVRKEGQIFRFQWRKKWLFRGMGLVLPGTGHLLAGSTLVGGGLLLLWCFGLATALACATWLPDPVGVGSSAAGLRFLLGSMPMVLAYVLAIPAVMRLER